MTCLTSSELNRLCDELLSVLEIREARLLNWGFINGAQTLDDLDAQLPEMLRHLPAQSPELGELWRRAQAQGVTAQQMLNNLQERKLVFKRRHYRTRFAETVRSLFLLRQRFSEDDWRIGERLVGDMKVLLQRRRYPRREISPDQLFGQLESLEMSHLRRDAVAELLHEADGQTLLLARFQAQAIVRLFRNLHRPDDSAVVVGAGTGAGKTKAFYIPALSYVADTLSERHHVQVLALYPRKELLKDQLRETYAEARKLDHLLREHDKRPITVGAYYGDVPRDARDVLNRGVAHQKNWRRTREKTGWVCPYVTCPQCGQQDMVWRDEDLEREAEANVRGIHGRYARLACLHCGALVGSDTLLLTRRQMGQQPPDILFTTTEMLNRRLSDATEHALFGIGVEAPPRLVLMDEIHLNEGIHGAQVAYLLRRWHHARGSHLSQQSLCMVGLSATVTQAETFFARLTGIPAPRVTYITPADADLVKEGIEYNLVLKGDPLSGTTLLSTSVRTAMLLCRVLDPFHRDVSGGAFGKRVFAFSDRLDVINRWHHIEKEVENPAEPYSQFLFVAPGDPSAKQRYEQGQNWWFVPEIHGDAAALTSGLRLDITSSQYAGVDEMAHLVIASSTLEVGYNDPRVGGIIQHKTPYSRAAFIQRKGRAGRQHAMRPWMVLITSAYGHDRWAFQHAESLFDPVLPPLDIPLENYYVLKIQATFALMDWLALALQRAGRDENVWTLLSSDEWQRDYSRDAARQAIVALLYRLLDHSDTLASFTGYLRDALQLDGDQAYAVNTILWGEPRPLLLEVIPSLLRQLETHWQSVALQEEGRWQIDQWTDSVSERPLPDFIPSTLFGDLKSPELLIHVPESRTPDGARPAMRSQESLSVALALSEFVPGKVNKRFADKDRIRESHWLEVPEPSAIQDATIELSQLSVQYDPAPVSVIVDDTNYLVYCPRAFTLDVVPRHVRPTSSARFLWLNHLSVRVQYETGGGSATEPGGRLHLSRMSPWRNALSAITAYTHANGCWAEVTRLAAGVQVFTRFEGGQERRETYRFAADAQPAAIGFTVDADALRFTCAPQDMEALRRSADWPALYQGLGSRFFLHLLQTDARAAALMLSDLEIEWLWQIALSMTVQTAVEGQVALSDAASLVRGDWVGHAGTVLRIIFQNRPQDVSMHDSAEGAAVGEAAGRAVEQVARESDNAVEAEDAGYLHAKLLGLMANPTIQAMLDEHLSVLWDDSHPGLDDWLQSTYAFSLGAALFATLLDLAPDVQPDDLHMDVVGNDIWISELAAGGVGLVARLSDAITQHPRRFDLHFARTIKTCHRAELATYLDHIADRLAEGDKALTDCFRNIRAAHGHDLPQIEQARHELVSALDQQGIPVTRRLGVALNAKFLRPNSDADTDALVATLVRFWQTEQNRLGCGIDLRVIAVAATQQPVIQDQVRSVLERVGDDRQRHDADQTYNLLQSLLWLGCQDACPDCIDRPQRYQWGPKPSRALLLALHHAEEDVIMFGQPAWLSSVTEQLAHKFEARIRCEQPFLPLCKAALTTLLTTPIEVGYQIHYPGIERIERQASSWNIHVILPELIES